jgi:hypothetical protein
VIRQYPFQAAQGCGCCNEIDHAHGGSANAARDHLCPLACAPAALAAGA